MTDTAQAPKDNAAPTMPTFWNRKAVPYILATLLNGGVLAGFQAPRILGSPPQDVAEVGKALESMDRGVNELVEAQRQLTTLVIGVTPLLEQTNESSRLQRDAFIEMTTVFRMLRDDLRYARERRLGLYDPLGIDDTLTFAMTGSEPDTEVGSAIASEVPHD